MDDTSGRLAGSGHARQDTALDDDPVLPAYGGGSLADLVPALLVGRPGAIAAALPEGVRAARQIVLLVLDGLGSRQLAERAGRAPALSSLAQGTITSVAPTTTATALTSLTTGCTPAEHGILGYRLAVGGEVLNVLRWRTPSGDMRAAIPPRSIQSHPPFCGADVPVLSRSEFAGSGFTIAHLDGARLVGWRMPSSLPVEVGRLLRADERFVYAYYDGIDKVAHECGLGDHFAVELTAADRIVADVLSVLTPGSALVVTADHGQVEVTEDPIVFDDDLYPLIALQSGEGRFRWLHAHPGVSTEELLQASRERYAKVAWVRTLDEIVDAGWFGGPLDHGGRARLGDVALVAREAVAFLDPADTGELRLVSRHGSLTGAEMFVPLLTASR